MTPQAITTISPDTARYAFVRAPGIGVVSSAIERPSSMSVAEAFAATTAAFEPTLHAMQRKWSAQLWLLAALPPREVHNVLQKRRALWGDESFSWIRGELQASSEMLLPTRHGERYVGVAELPLPLFSRAAEHARKDPTALLFLTATPAVERVSALAEACLADWQIDWSAATSLIGREFECCIRATGNFDDVEIAIDAFLEAVSLPMT